MACQFTLTRQVDPTTSHHDRWIFHIGKVVHAHISTVVQIKHMRGPQGTAGKPFSIMGDIGVCTTNAICGYFVGLKVSI
jgi:hypothetical protein